MGSQKLDILRRAKIRGVFKFCRDLNILNNNTSDYKQVTKRRMFDYFSVKPRFGYNILEGRDPDRLKLNKNNDNNKALRNCTNPDSRITHNDPRYTKKRSQGTWKFTSEDVNLIKHLWDKEP